MSLIKEKKSVEMLDLKGNVLATYESISDASRKNNISISSISQVCTGIRKTAGTYIWRFTNIKKNYENKPILQFSNSGVLLNRGKNVIIAANFYNIKVENIMNNLNGKTETCNGCVGELE